jgi:integrase
MNLTFSLDNKRNKKGESIILAYITSKGSKLRPSTGINCKPADFHSGETQYVKKSDPKSREKNQDLFRQRDFIENYKGIDFLKDYYKFKTGEVRSNVKKSLIDYYTEWSDFCKDEISNVTGEILSARTIQIYKTTGNVLADFQVKHYIVTIKKFNNDFYDDFRRYILTERENQNTKKPGCDIGTFSNHIKNLKKFGKWLQRYEPIPNDFRDWKKKYNAHHSEPLREEELIMLYNSKGKNPRTERARLILLALCSTSLRISDYNRLDLDKHLVNGLIQYNFGSQKTRVSYHIPYFDDSYFRPVYCLEALANIPEGMKLSGQKLNDALEDLCKELEFTRIRITSKTGRRTWATLNLKQGKNPEMIMYAGGWRSRAAFDHYVGIDTRDVMKEFKDKAQYLKVSK